MSTKTGNTQQQGAVARTQNQAHSTGQDALTLEQDSAQLARAVRSSETDPNLMRPADMLFLQRMVGNGAVNQLLQAKLQVGPAGDRYEQEADRVAEQVVSGPAPAAGERINSLPSASASVAPSSTQRQEEDEELMAKPLLQRQEEEELMAKASGQGNGDGGFTLDEGFQDRLNRSQASGSALPDDVVTDFGSKMGADLTGVRVHTGAESVQMSQDIQAKAFTHGSDIHFNSGQYDPSSTQGKTLLAHEVTHVLQQGGASIQRANGGDQEPAPQNQAKGTGGAQKEEPKTEVKPAGQFDVLQAVAKVPDWDTLRSRLKERELDSTEMLELCADYVLAVSAPKPQTAKAKYLFKVISDQLSGSGAFGRRTGSEPGTNSNKFGFWSGAKSQGEEFADKEGAVTLERSVAGSLFDGLNFGAGWNQALTHQWDELSRLYAEGTIGEAHIHQYRGVRAGSVFDRVEYPAIKDSIALGTVQPVVHLYANWGSFGGLKYGAPFYASGEESRKKEKEVEGKSGLEEFMTKKWTRGDALEKEGGYWPSGKGGQKIDAPGHDRQVRAGEEW